MALSAQIVLRYLLLGINLNIFCLIQNILLQGITLAMNIGRIAQFGVCGLRVEFLL